MRHYILIVSFFIFTNLHLSLAQEYKATELFAITWGDEANQLKICPPDYEDVDGTPEDSTDDMIWPCGGPTRAFVDNKENVYIDSYLFGHFKVFNSHGSLILDLSKGSAGYNSEFFSSSPGDYVVDSNLLIYMISFPELTYVPVINLSGKLVDKLYPWGPDKQHEITNIQLNSNDIITFSCFDHYRTYREGKFYAGGSSGWLSRDGNYYVVIQDDERHLKFKKYGNPDNHGKAAWQEIKYVDLGKDMPIWDFMGVDDNMLLYVMFADANDVIKIRTYTIKYVMEDELIIHQVINKYDLTMQPFLRADGNIYEFRCLDDGLHVIRWSRH